MELSIGAFCTEFRCEQLGDDDIIWGLGPGSRPSGSGKRHKKLDLGTRVSVSKKYEIAQIESLISYPMKFLFHTSTVLVVCVYGPLNTVFV